MAATNLYERQEPKYAMFDLGPSNIGSNGYTITIPRGAQTCDMAAETVTAFDGTGTVTLSIADGTTTFVSAEDIKTTGVEAVDRTVKFYPDGGTITVSIADANSDSAAGRVVGYIAYIQLGNGTSIQE